MELCCNRHKSAYFFESGNKRSQKNDGGSHVYGRHRDAFKLELVVNFLKKRSGARNSAMAELLSKSNETQIKDRSAVDNSINGRSPATSPEKANVKRPVVLEKPQRPVTDVMQNRASAAPKLVEKTKMNTTVRKAPTPESKASQPAKRPSVMNETKEAAVKQMPTEAKISVQSAKMPVNKMQAKKKTKKVKEDKIEVWKENFKNSVWKAMKKLPAGSSMIATIVLVILGVGGVAAMLIFNEPASAVIVPDAYIGSVPENEEEISILDKFNIVDADDLRHDGRHYVTISVFEGAEYICSTSATTVGELLQTMDVTVEESYQLRHNESDMISSDATVNIDKITYGTVTETEAVPYETKYVDVQNIPRGRTKVVSAGANGVKTATYTVTYVNGVETERVLTDERITTKPTSQVVNRGVGGTLTIGGKSYSYSYYIDVRTTVYTGGGTTASGLPATEAVIAVDPRVIPLGTQVYVADSYCPVGFRTAADTGGSIKGNIIDIYFDSDNPFLWGYGRRSARVYILD